MAFIQAKSAKAKGVKLSTAGPGAGADRASGREDAVGAAAGVGAGAAAGAGGGAVASCGEGNASPTSQKEHLLLEQYDESVSTEQGSYERRSQATPIAAKHAEARFVSR